MLLYLFYWSLHVSACVRPSSEEQIIIAIVTNNALGRGHPKTGDMLAYLFPIVLSPLLAILYLVGDERVEMAEVVGSVAYSHAA
jgi:hypothetical protein